MDLAYLADLSDMQYEAERCKLINQLIRSAPDYLQRKLLRTQMTIDQVREHSSFEQLMQYLFAEINEHIEDLSDQFVAVAHAAGCKPTALPSINN